VPKLRDLCYRAVANMAVNDYQDIDLCEAHPPGDGSSHDLTRLTGRDRRAVLHLLDRQKLLGREPRLWSRFFQSAAEARLAAKIRPATRDVVGLTQMNDDQGKAPQAAVEQAQFEREKPPMEMLEFVQICSPLLLSEYQEEGEEAEARRKERVKLFRKCIARINKSRPKLVVVSSEVPVDDACRKLLARINESIPVVLHEPSGDDKKPIFCSFWFSGIQGICLSYDLAVGNDETKKTEQVEWLREQLDLVRMSKHPCFCFVNGPVHSGRFPLVLLKKLARGHTLEVFSPTATAKPEEGKKPPKQPGIKLPYRANEKLPKGAVWLPNDNQEDETMADCDDESVKSTDSVEDAADEFMTLVDSSPSTETGLRWIRVDPVHADEWSHDMEWVE